MPKVQKRAKCGAGAPSQGCGPLKPSDPVPSPQRGHEGSGAKDNAWGILDHPSLLGVRFVTLAGFPEAMAPKAVNEKRGTCRGMAAGLG